MRFAADHAKLSAIMASEATHQLFARWRAGDPQAVNELMPLIYEELRQVASRHLRGQRADHTLQTTALIHEAYLRLAGAANVDVADRVHFVSLASRIMRHVLVDHARARLASKRHAGLRVSLSEASDVAIRSELDVIAIDEALSRLAELDQQQAHVVELRYFGGLSVEDTALALSVSASTVKRDWTMARTWLRTELRPNSAS